MKCITVFNNKGGVGKTSLVYHLAWMYDKLDYNVLVADLDPQANLTSMFLDDESRPHHRDAGRLLGESGNRGLHLATSGQVLREYLVVATRPLDANGLGLPVRDATANVSEFLRRIQTQPDRIAWRRTEDQ